jgi:hypothetical protein
MWNTPFDGYDRVVMWADRACAQALQAWVAGGQDLPGLWLDADGLDAIDPEQAAHVGMCLSPCRRHLWWRAAAERAIQQRKPDAAHIRAARRALKALANDAFLRLTQEGVAAVLQATPGCKSLLKAWGGAGGDEEAGRDEVTQVVQLYMQILPELPKPLKMTPMRARLVRARLSDFEQGDLLALDESGAIGAMRRYFERVRASDFLMGRGTCDFRADFEWLMRPNNFVKVLEGRYDNRKPASSPSEPFMRFMRIYPNPGDHPRAWSIWNEARLDDRLDEVMRMLEDERLRYRDKRLMPPAWKFLQNLISSTTEAC